MKEIWVLAVKTSLPNVCESKNDLKCEMIAFDGFEKAREALRTKLKGYAFSENSMFDGDGHITMFDEYINERMDPPEEEDEEDISAYYAFSAINETLKEAFSGRDSVLDLPDGEYTDWSIAVEVEAGRVSFFGTDDGPYNGYNPVLITNIFSMEKEQDYYLYVDDLFGQEDSSSELYIDLKKVELN